MKIENSEQKIMDRNFRLVLFELSSGGHYPEYITHLIKYWQTNNLIGKFILVVSPKFCQAHPEVIALVQNNSEESIEVISITEAEATNLPIARNTFNRIRKAFQEFKLACKYAENLKADCLFFSYLDTKQIPLFFTQYLPFEVSGIYFRPRFHYQKLGSKPKNLLENLVIKQEKILLKCILQKPYIKNIFCLDPYAGNYLDSKADIIRLADPIDLNWKSIDNIEKTKNRLNIEPNRKVLLLFGGLTKRKGILPLLKALTFISSEIQEDICLLLVGAISPQLKQRIQPLITQLKDSSKIKIVMDCHYVTETEIRTYFQLADIILALYQRHVGMSGILIRAAAAKKPVLSSNYGLMGALTRRYRLGLEVDSANPKAIAHALQSILTNQEVDFINHDLMELFATQNSATNFTQTVFKYLK